MTIETSKPSVLVVDDDPAVLRFLSRFFERDGWTVLEAVTAEDALRTWDLRLPDVVLLDLHLPGLSGMHALEVLALRGAAVVVLTGYAEVSTAVEAMRSGAYSFLGKPVDTAALREAVQGAARRTALQRASDGAAGRPVGDDAVLGPSSRMRELVREVDVLAGSGDTTVVLLGESGTGKSWLARRIHASSPRSRAPFIEINCAGLTSTFLDSELFGHEKGAFTDAKETKRGLFELADGGTLFLDEIGDLAHELQPKLLKVLETRTFRRLGGTREIAVDVRLVAATHRDLTANVQRGTFREDLYYRLSVYPVTIPPLRERSDEDVLTLLHATLRELAPRLPGAPRRFGERALELLVQYRWPGNVRELRNSLERALIRARGEARVESHHLPDGVRESTGGRVTRDSYELVTLEALELSHIERALYMTGGNRTEAARRLGISRATLHAKIRQHNMDEIGRERPTSPGGGSRGSSQVRAA